MTRAQMLKEEFSGVCGAINLYIDGITIFYVDVDADRVEGYKTVTARCGCCSDTIDWESDLSYEIEVMDDMDFKDLIDGLSKLKQKI